MSIIITIIIESIKSFRYKILNSLYFIASMIEYLLPYVMLNIGYILYDNRGGVFYGSELVLPLIVFVITGLMKQYAKRKGMVDEIPVPNRGLRFTKVDEEGNVHMNRNKYMEMMVYVAEVENYLERHGKL